MPRWRRSWRLRGVDLPVDPKARLDRGPRAGAVPDAGRARRPGSRCRAATGGGSCTSASRSLTCGSCSDSRCSRGQRTGSIATATASCIGSASARLRSTAVDSGGWTGRELVVFKMHIPSEIPYHNAPSRKTERGNILRWEQPLAARLKGEPLDVEVRMEPESILYTTLLLFGVTDRRRRDDVRPRPLVGRPPRS